MIYAMHQIQVACILHHGQSSEYFRNFLRRLADEQLLSGERLLGPETLVREPIEPRAELSAELRHLLGELRDAALALGAAGVDSTEHRLEPQRNSKPPRRSPRRS